MEKTIEKRQNKNKDKLLEILKKTPIVQIACERIGVSRASYYRWRKENVEFAKKSDQALFDGSLLVNDMAESYLINAIKEKNMTAIIFWLKSHHPAYTTSIELTSGTDKSLSQTEIEILFELLYNEKTFKKGQELLSRYVFSKRVSEKMATLVIKIFMSQMKVVDVLTRKNEAEIMAQVMLRKERSKETNG